jgi:hypothetical protein
MKKAENEKGYLISYGIAVLLTVAFLCIFLMGSDGIAQINNIVCNNLQDYTCTGSEYLEGETFDSGTTCVKLCYDNGFEVNIFSSLELYGFLYPATGSKNLLGTALTTMGWAGCSVEKRGRSIIVNLTFIQDDSGAVVILKCTPCDGCCSISG